VANGNTCPRWPRAAVASGIDGIFMEVHPDRRRPCPTGRTCCASAILPALLKLLKRIDEAVSQTVTVESFDARPPVPTA